MMGNKILIKTRPWWRFGLSELKLDPTEDNHNTLKIEGLGSVTAGMKLTDQWRHWWLKAIEAQSQLRFARNHLKFRSKNLIEKIPFFLTQRLK